ATRDFAGEMAAEYDLMYPGWQDDQFTPEVVLEEARQMKLVLAHRVIGPFLEAYSVLADELAAAGDAPVEQKSLVETCLKLAKQKWLQKTLHSPESISKDYFVNAFQLAKNYKLVDGRPGVGEEREALADELRTMVRRIDDLRHIAQASGQPVLIVGGQNG
ncbi:MAG: hypothetical protein KDB83_00205, partial [Actinobacteria bacterium]|nr:hypothetical protein [Actinomycetota bacterium]MCB0920666.1 hypothetical protein [Actinomycetota bacterium]